MYFILTLLEIIVTVLVKQVLSFSIDIASKHALHANCAKDRFFMLENFIQDQLVDGINMIQMKNDHGINGN